MNKTLLLILTILILISCGNSSNDIYKTKSGEYASKSGNFIVKFPTKPDLTIIDNKIGLDEFQIHLFRTALGPNKIFTVEYVDYPEYLLKSSSDEQIFTQGITNLANKMSESFELEFQESVEQHGLNGKYFVFRLNQIVIKKGTKGYLEGKIFRDKNRVYTITYFGHSDKNVDSFMESFRMIK